MLAVVSIAGLSATLSSVAIGNLLVPLLEQRFQHATIGNPATLTGVIALGGGDERIREACRLAELHPHLKVFVSGAGEKDTVRAMLGARRQACSFEVENNSYNTRSNAVFTHAALRPRSTERWLLVTSASHMPRAIGAFRKAGVPVEPWPVFDRNDKVALPVSQARHEWIGLIAYWLMGHSSELFPAPRQRQPAAVSLTTGDDRSGGGSSG